MNDLPEVMTAIQAAQYLGAHVETIRRLARRGELPSFKVGKDWRFRRDAVARWAEEQRPPDGACTVLVIDDEPNVCSVIGRLIQRFGCRVRTALDGAEGMTLVEAEPPDLIFLDLVMPGMNGVEFLEALRPQHPELPVVIVTGYPDSEMMLEASNFAPLMLLPKPVVPELIERTLSTVLGKKRERREVG